MEQGLTVDVWTSRPIVMVDVASVGHAESRSRQGSDALLDDVAQQDSEDGEKACISNSSRI